MTEIPRVLIAADTFKVTPHDNVLTASAGSLVFNAEAAALGLTLGKGVVVRPPGRANTQSPPGTENVIFDRDFGDPPMFLMGWTLRAQPALFIPARNDGFRATDQRFIKAVHALVQSDRVHFRNYFLNSEGAAVRWRALV